MSIESNFNRAIQRHQSGDLDGAIELYRAVLAEQPQHADALHMMGVIARQRGNAELALKLVEAALAVKADMALAWYNRALMLRGMNRRDDAILSIEQALHFDAKLADALDLAGTLYREAGRLDDAGQQFQKAIALRPDNVRYRSNLAILLMSQDDLRGAYQVVKDSESVDGDSLSFALGNVLRASGYTEKSIPHYQRVSRLMPDSPEAQMNEAMALLQLGELEKAWAIWKKLPDEKENLNSIPRWQGEKVGHLLLHEEQGMGDAIQCVRYIPLIRDRVGKITLQLNKALQKVMQFNFPDVDVITLDDPVPTCDARAQLMQLPALLNTTLESIPATVPYMRCADDWCAPWSVRLADVKSPRVGFVWAGNPNHRNNRNRSLTLQQFMPLFDAARGYGVSLQKWSAKDHASMATTGLFDADDYLTDFTSTAGLMMELDLIVTVDTSVAHLAGALGRPVWVLVPFDPDWRWMLARADTPWYPSMRLFRQSKPFNWPSALVPITEELKKFIAGDKSVLIAPKWQGPPARQNPYAVILD